MQAIQLRESGGLDKLEVVELAAPGEPGPGEIKVRLHASSLNFHDYAVVAGMIPTQGQRIPMSDGAGVVEAVGEGVSEFAVGDHVVSTFFRTGWKARQEWVIFVLRRATAWMATLANWSCARSSGLPISPRAIATQSPLP